MRLTWHIVQKDFRRLRLPLALWLILMLAHTALLLKAAGRGEVSPASFEGLGYFSNTWGFIVAAVGLILAAWLVMEDSLVDTRAFWTTRPISGGRLLVAKTLGAVLMFSVLPALMLTPVWLGCGFSVSEWWLASSELALQQGMLSVVALALACITATSGQFLVRLVGAAVILPLYTAYALGNFVGQKTGISEGLAESRLWLVLALVILSPLLLIGHQFLTRRTARSAALLGLGLILMLGIRFGWAWDFSPLVHSLSARNRTKSASADHGAEFKLEFITALRNRGLNGAWRIRLVNPAADVPPGAYVRLNAARVRWVKAGERIPSTVTFGRNEPPSRSIVRQVAGLSPATPGSANGLINGDDFIQPAFQAQYYGMTLETDIKATLMQGRLLGEIPLRLGAELQVGASRTRIAGIERVEGQVHVRLVERDAWPITLGGRHDGSALPSRRKIRPAEDAFVLLNRAQAHDQFPAVNEIGTVRINSVMIGQRELVITPPSREVNGQTEEIPDWVEGAVIVKVRFLSDHSFTRSLTAAPFVPEPAN